ncbi:hypothetical protein GE061_020263 [Apolygus lucorum]|uniref:C2H2-type domain-containing protein n=1 Tax=Apolygus lucorum TaxID=248454 RepID=A0A8S9WM63_APOLU|nr:hypothetical protein GE061_020263 [Apolygus lucorum]
MKNFQCADCGKWYGWKESLYNHRNYECGKERQFACPQCPYRASRKGSLKTHLFTQHAKGTRRTVIAAMFA